MIAKLYLDRGMQLLMIRKIYGLTLYREGTVTFASTWKHLQSKEWAFKDRKSKIDRFCERAASQVTGTSCR
jgi:hypothetical protein